MVRTWEGHIERRRVAIRPLAVLTGGWLPMQCAVLGHVVICQDALSYRTKYQLSRNIG